MDSFVVAGIVFACTFGGVVLGMCLRAVLPERHLDSESRDAMKLGAGLIGTLSALVLGLLVASAKSSFDAQKAGFQQMATNLTLLDRGLTIYGPEATEARRLLRRAVTSLVDHRWPANGSGAAGLEADEITTNNDAFFAAVRDLTPKNEVQKTIQSQAFQMSAELGKTRWQLIHAGASSIPIPFLVVLVFWLTVLFTIFGLLAPRNITTGGVMFVCALSVTGALFLIMELDQPYSGLIRISDQPLRTTLSHMIQ